MVAKQASLVKELHRAAKAIQGARALIVTAGSGIGADSGLPVYGTPQELWNAYPALKKRNLVFQKMSSPHWFQTEPEFAWGFFGHRYNIYKNASPHEGFHILKKWAETKDRGNFVYTTNVDGHFQRAGFDGYKIVEVDGSINYLQPLIAVFEENIWPVPGDQTFEVDEEKLTLTSPLPFGPPGVENPILARPNVKMFKDKSWISKRTTQQDKDFFEFRMGMMKEGGIPFVVIEIGAGISSNSVRKMSEDMVSPHNTGTLIRINPSDAKLPNGDSYISLPLSSIDALKQIDEIITA